MIYHTHNEWYALSTKFYFHDFNPKPISIHRARKRPFHFVKYIFIFVLCFMIGASQNTFFNSAQRYILFTIYSNGLNWFKKQINQLFSMFRHVLFLFFFFFFIFLLSCCFFSLPLFSTKGYFLLYHCCCVKILLFLQY